MLVVVAFALMIVADLAVESLEPHKSQGFLIVFMSGKPLIRQG